MYIIEKFNLCFDLSIGQKIRKASEEKKAYKFISAAIFRKDDNLFST